MAREKRLFSEDHFGPEILYAGWPTAAINTLTPLPAAHSER
jgi:hypothetical protein